MERKQGTKKQMGSIANNWVMPNINVNAVLAKMPQVHMAVMAAGTGMPEPNWKPPTGIADLPGVREGIKPNRVKRASAAGSSGMRRQLRAKAVGGGLQGGKGLGFVEGGAGYDPYSLDPTVVATGSGGNFWQNLITLGANVGSDIARSQFGSRQPTVVQTTGPQGTSTVYRGNAGGSAGTGAVSIPGFSGAINLQNPMVLAALALAALIALKSATGK